MPYQRTLPLACPRPPPQAKFDAEAAALKAKAAEAGKTDEKAQRLTGKAWFVRQVGGRWRGVREQKDWVRDCE